MINLRYISIILLTFFVVSNFFIADVAAGSDDKTMDVKLNDFFELKLPDYTTSPGSYYTWIPRYDKEYIIPYHDETYKNLSFKAIKKGKTTILMQLHENNPNTGVEIIKTVTYTINIK